MQELEKNLRTYLNNIPYDQKYCIIHTETQLESIYSHWLDPMNAFHVLELALQVKSNKCRKLGRLFLLLHWSLWFQYAFHHLVTIGKEMH
jgi:hypothetical protein